MEDRVLAKGVAWGMFKAGWDASVSRGGGFLKSYPGEPAWEVIAREEFEAFMLEQGRMWEEANLAAGIKAFNQVYVQRDTQPIPIPAEATGKLWR